MRSRTASLAAMFVVVLATAARASVPAGASVRIEHTIDIASFSRTIAARYDIVVRRALTADIDRDGDLDVVASTDRGFLVWVNDGNGRLTSKKPEHPTTVDGSAPDDTWQHGSARDEQTIQNELPSSRLTAVYAHAPPPSIARRADALRAVGALDPTFGSSIPRAPPLSH